MRRSGFAPSLQDASAASPKRSMRPSKADTPIDMPLSASTAGPSEEFLNLLSWKTFSELELPLWTPSAASKTAYGKASWTLHRSARAEGWALAKCVEGCSGETQEHEWRPDCRSCTRCAVLRQRGIRSARTRRTSGLSTRACMHAAGKMGYQKGSCCLAGHSSFSGWVLHPGLGCPWAGLQPGCRTPAISAKYSWQSGQTSSAFRGQVEWHSRDDIDSE